MKAVAKITVHAGGGWEGHVVYTVCDPRDPNKRHVSSNLEEVQSFCTNNKLELDADFIKLVMSKLVFQSKTGLVIPTEFIDEQRPISSASEFLRKNFSNYAAR